MVYTALEYSRHYRFRNKFISVRSVLRRCENKQLPKNHIPYKLPVVKNGAWVIEVKESV
jgi:hypothetical protein